jgi:hypothetical protein
LRYQHQGVCSIQGGKSNRPTGVLGAEYRHQGVCTDIGETTHPVGVVVEVSAPRRVLDTEGEEQQTHRGAGCRISTPRCV